MGGGEPSGLRPVPPLSRLRPPRVGEELFRLAGVWTTRVGDPRDLERVRRLGDSGSRGCERDLARLCGSAFGTSRNMGELRGMMGAGQIIMVIEGCEVGANIEGCVDRAEVRKGCKQRDWDVEEKM